MNTNNLFKTPVGGVIPSLHVDHILGMTTGHADNQLAGVRIQFEAEGQTLQMTIDLDNAMYLLACLKSTQLEFDIPFPDDPRDPNWKASDYVSKKSNS